MSNHTTTVHDPGILVRLQHFIPRRIFISVWRTLNFLCENIDTEELLYFHDTAKELQFTENSDDFRGRDGRGIRLFILVIGNS